MPRPARRARTCLLRVRSGRTRRSAARNTRRASRAGAEAHRRCQYSTRFGENDSIYTQYSAFGDGNAPNYDAKQITLGGKQALTDTLSYRLEALYRWESAPAQSTSYARFLTTLEVVLGDVGTAARAGNGRKFNLPVTPPETPPAPPQ